MGLLAPLISFTPGADIKASEANSNNTAIATVVNTFAVLTDVAKTIVAQHVFSPATALPPFALSANAQAQLVVGLRAQTCVIADTTTAFATPRTINGTTFDGSANITVTAAAGTLTGATLAANVLASSLTSVGTLASLVVSGTINTQNMRLLGGQIDEIATNTLAAITVNFSGFGGGTTQFRNFDLYDGKNALVASFTGLNKALAIAGPFGMNGKTPVANVAAPAVATDLATVIVLANDMRTRLINLGVYT